MVELYLLVFGPLAVGLILGFLWWLIWGRKAGLPLGIVGGFTLAAGLLALLGELTVRLMMVRMLLPFGVPTSVAIWFSEQRFMIPLVLGILGMILLTFPVRPRRAQRTADLARRTALSFTRRRWLVAAGVALVLNLVIAVLAGLASRPDSETGEYKEYWVEPGGQIGIGTTIYGWFYSVPALILTGVLIAIAVVSVFLIARPSFAEDRERDIRERSIRTRNVFLAVTGVLLIHLGVIFRSLYSTASMRGTFPTPSGYLTISPPFSAFGPGFFGASIVCSVIGIALWAVVVFSTIPSRRPALDTSGS